MQQTLFVALVIIVVMISAPAVADLAPAPAVAASLLIAKPEAGRSEQTASLAVGQHLLVQLPAQLGAGFDWAVTSKPTPLLKSLGDRVLPSQTPLPGGEQLREFEFVGEKAGTATVTFAYRQPFRKDVPPSKTFTVTVRIEK